MKQGLVRIIGGKWRGRRIKVPDVEGLRPTPDRVRETLFNWLAPRLAGAVCLDLFAGTGALGFEALSRGAAHVVMVDESAEVVALMKEACDVLQTTNVEICQVRAPNGLKSPEKPFDIVFLDPPYQEDLLLPTCEYLESQGFLAEQAYIYLEADRSIRDNELPQGWRVLKSGKAGQVYYHLAIRETQTE